ncbi:hypothetical protein LTR70_005476 [Exophiala xenobiotica]|uniref:Uncharacterized protein n=1 Tax=Lithohypha guttulata TaxID=1690604 RepID=A0ABR0KDR0_9EURO|nr:hypothetical protein LTR24_003843 [Lithohypha guttulata]KAK5318333.1 hypothetical protein LTR70_005476 [Exophiala xenobiotica]
MDWQQALERHRRLLEEHLGVWQMVEQSVQPGSLVRSTAEICLHNTRSMIQACANIPVENTGVDHTRKETVVGHHKHSAEEPRNQAPKKRARKVQKNQAGDLESSPAAHVPPVTDASGLFTIDPNPTKVDILLSDPNKSSKSKKRKQRQSVQEITPLVDDELQTTGDSLPLRKRVKTAHEATVQPSPEEIEERENSFEAKVELRLKQKEQDRQKKATKKRKRESDQIEAGFESVINRSLEEHPPPKRRPGQKGKADVNEQWEASTQPEPGATSDNIRQANTSKRVKPAAAEAAGPAVQKAVVLGAKRKGVEVIELDDGSEYGGYDEQTSRKKKKKRNNRPAKT